jgi:hypothetical protein
MRMVNDGKGERRPGEALPLEGERPLAFSETAFQKGATAIAQASPSRCPARLSLR